MTHSYTPPHQLPSQQPQQYAGDDFSDWDSVPEQNTLIPNSDYKIVLEKINQETVKSGENAGKPRYNCHFKITDNRQNGRYIFMDFMPNNDISRTQVKALAVATNTALVGNKYAVLLAVIDKVFIGSVGVRKDKTGSYQDQNTIWTFKQLPVEQHQTQQAYTPAPPVQPPQPIRTGETAFDANGKPIFKATDGQWYYS